MKIFISIVLLSISTIVSAQFRGVPLGNYNPVLITGSVNAFGSVSNNTQILSVNNDLNLITFTNRLSQFNAPSGCNTGWIYSKWSTDNGLTWDSTFLRAPTNNIYKGRFPSGVILNPIGNSDVCNAYIVGAGPVSGPNIWEGNWFASKKLCNSTPTDTLSLLNSTAPFAAQYFASNSMGASQGMAYSTGLIHIKSFFGGDSSIGIRINTAKHNGANGVIWNFDSIPVYQYRIQDDSSPKISFSEDGITGYILINGYDDTINNPNSNLIPILFQTIDGGVNWTKINYNDLAQDPILMAMLPIETSGTGLIKPFFGDIEGSDVTVDMFGNLHYFTAIAAGYSNDPDSLGYTFSNNGFNSLLFDCVYEKALAQWKINFIDTLYADYASSVNGSQCNTENTITTNGGKIQQTSRLQISRTQKGEKIFYSWADTDTILANFCNVYPDIYMKGYNYNMSSYTPTFSITQNSTEAYFFHASDKTLGSGAKEQVIYTITRNNQSNADFAQYIYFIGNGTVSDSDYSIYVSNEEQHIYKNSNIRTKLKSNTIEINLTESSQVEITIINTVGQNIYSTTSFVNIGKTELNIENIQLSNGIYFCHVKVGNLIQNFKLVIEN